MLYGLRWIFCLFFTGFFLVSVPKKPSSFLGMYPGVQTLFSVFITLLLTPGFMQYAVFGVSFSHFCWFRVDSVARADDCLLGHPHLIPAENQASWYQKSIVPELFYCFRKSRVGSSKPLTWELQCVLSYLVWLFTVAYFFIITILH